MGSTYSSLFTIVATDANNDPIDFTATSGPSELTVSSGGVVSWTNVQYSANNSVIITVSDGAANAIFAPKVSICDCKNGGKTKRFSCNVFSSCLVW